MKFPASIQKLITEFSKLPTVGPKTAERFAFYLLKQKPADLQALSQAISELQEKIIICASCNSLAESNPCPICADAKRQKTQLCIVAGPRDLMTLEATSQYQGIYFVLNGELNHLDGVGPEQLNIELLQKKLKTEKITEIILALNPTIEGETTAMYLAKLIKPLNIKITRLAKGLPMGADLEYVDELTLGNALKYRNVV